jgi:hypothetical protein
MSINYRRLQCAPERVFEVLADGWVFPSWVVGASRMRYVDDAWPSPGTQLHHSFGVWPVLLDDETTMLEWDPPRHAVMQPKGWPIGEALVTIDVKPRRDGCVVRIMEKAAARHSPLCAQRGNAQAARIFGRGPREKQRLRGVGLAFVEDWGQ